MQREGLLQHRAAVPGERDRVAGTIDGVPALPRGLQTAAALPAVTARLLDRGMHEDDVEKILGANFLRVFEIIEKAHV